MKNKKTLTIVAVVVVIVAIIVGINIYQSQKEPEVIKIGAILPLTGKQARYGQYIKQALELGREEINRDGGINGKILEIIYEDDQAEPNKAANAMTKLAEIDKVPIVFGSWASSCVLAQAPIAEKTHTPILAEAQSPKIRYAGDYIFRIQPDTKLYIDALVPYVRNQLNIKNVVILFVNNEYGIGAEKLFREKFNEMGGTVIYSESFPQGTIDFRTFLIRVKEKNPEAIFVPAMIETAYLIKQAKEMGIRSQFIAGPPIESSESINIAGKSLEGVIYPHHFDPDSEASIVQDFINKYYTKYNEYPEGYAALAYDAMFIIAKVLIISGKDKEKIKDNLYKIHYYGVTGHTSFDNYGDVVKNIVIRTFKNNKFTTIWK